MGIDIFRRENWDRWESGPYTVIDFSLDPEKDRWLIRHLIGHGSEIQRRRMMIKFGFDDLPAPPVNIDDPEDTQYAPYLLLREQVMREDDYWTLKTAMLEAPDIMMRRFAFSRLTGYSWPPDERDAYSYRTYACGLKSQVSREDIEDLCRELVYRNGRYAKRAAEWLERLPTFTDDELVEWASGKTERRFDNDLEAWMRKRMAPVKDVPEREDLEDKICGIFDATIFQKYQRRYLYGSGIVFREAVEDSFTEFVNRRLDELKKPYKSIVTAVTELMRAGDRDISDLTSREISRIAWSVSPRSRQHSYFLWMAYWYGIDVDEDNDRALKLLADAADRGHMRSYREIVEIYASGEYVRRDFKQALRWQEKKTELLHRAYDGDEHRDAKYCATRKPYAEALKVTGDLLMEAGYAKRAKQFYRKAEQLMGEGG